MGMPEGKLRLSRSQQQRHFFNATVTVWIGEAFARNGRWQRQQFREQLRSINIKPLLVLKTSFLARARREAPSEVWAYL
jgi:hypothetical protein